MATYLPNTPRDVQDMLKVIGVRTVEDLFAEIPPELRLNRPLNLPPGMSEAELVKKVKALAAKNTDCEQMVSFLGAGAYDHLIPTVLDHLLLRGDLFTAYTPYQAEISQGTLQVIYEYQSLISHLTGMDQSNASMYDGSSALGEAAVMAISQTRRRKVVAAQTVHPEYRQVMETLIQMHDVEVVSVPFEDGVTDPARVNEHIDQDTAAVVVQYPNFLGLIEDVEAIARHAHEAGALLIVVANPIALGLLKAPGDLGADIVVGEGQPLGIPQGFGGPYLGFLAAQKALLRRMPGRIAGLTHDANGNRGFVLTLQAREQHIRREKAGSNICSNQALMALNATMYLCLLGSPGLKDVANQCFQKAHYLKKELQELPGVNVPFRGSFFHEFVIRIPNARKLLGRMAKRGIHGGVLLERWYATLKDHVLIAVTEKRTVNELDDYVGILREVLS